MNITLKGLKEYIINNNVKVKERLRAIRVVAEVFEEYEDYLRTKGGGGNGT